MRRENVTRYILPLREGGSLPALAEADDGCLWHKYNAPACRASSFRFFSNARSDCEMHLSNIMDRFRIFTINIQRNGRNPQVSARSETVTGSWMLCI